MLLLIQGPHIGNQGSRTIRPHLSFLCNFFLNCNLLSKDKGMEGRWEGGREGKKKGGREGSWVKEGLGMQLRSSEAKI